MSDQTTLFDDVGTVRWRKHSADRWTTDDGRHVEYLPMFDSWQWSTAWETGTAATMADAQAAAERAVIR